MSTFKGQEVNVEKDDLDPCHLHEQMFVRAASGDEICLQRFLDQWKRQKLDPEIIAGCPYGAVQANRQRSVSLLLNCGATIRPDTVSIAIQDSVSTDVWLSFLGHEQDVNGKN